MQKVFFFFFDSKNLISLQINHVIHTATVHSLLDDVFSFDHNVILHTKWRPSVFYIRMQQQAIDKSSTKPTGRVYQGLGSFFIFYYCNVLLHIKSHLHIMGCHFGFLNVGLAGTSQRRQ